MTLPKSSLVRKSQLAVCVAMSPIWAVSPKLWRSRATVQFFAGDSAVSPVTADRVQRLMVPLDALDKTIREADVRKNFGIQVLGIELPDGSVQFPPELDMPLSFDNFRD